MSGGASIIVDPRDSVAVALQQLGQGRLECGVQLRDAVPAGHKFALRAHAPGDRVFKLGQAIGVARQHIAAGEHVHTHNLDCDGKADRQAPVVLPAALSRRIATFQGYRRADGRAGTRNYVAIVTSVNCSATVARRIAAHFTPERLASWPNVDGVCVFTHTTGCGMSKEGRGIDNLRRTVAGHAAHPNVAATLLVSLGCEVNQPEPLLESAGLKPSPTLRVLGIQQSGGTAAAIRAGIEAVEAMLPIADAARRSQLDARLLTLGLQCGGSDGYSALSANPALGRAADLLVAAGGRVVLSETPEIYGAEHLLLCRAATPDVATRLVDRLQWWEVHAGADGAGLDNNPSPGNRAGGITTILEKSLGAVAKAGGSALRAVVDYAEPVLADGLTFMDTPGFDPCSATGQIAGGANLIAFTTGRGAVFGSRPTPTLKLSSNSALADSMPDDIDIDCGRLITGKATLDELGEEIFAALLATASGRRSRSELAGFGDEEFVPWVPGATF